MEFDIFPLSTKIFEASVHGKGEQVGHVRAQSEEKQRKIHRKIKI